MPNLPAAIPCSASLTGRTHYKRALLAVFLCTCTFSATPFTIISARAEGTATLPVVPVHSVYPSIIAVHDTPRVTNSDMDCLWNVDCSSGAPVFHVMTQEILGRVSGWMQRGTFKKKSKKIVFVTWGSTYRTTSSSNSDGTAAGSEAAAEDFAAEMSGAGARSLTCPTFAVPASQVQCWTLRGDGSPGNPKSDHFWFITWWSGTAEVEMAAYANTRIGLTGKTFDAIAAQTMGGSASSSATPTPTATATSSL